MSAPATPTQPSAPTPPVLAAPAPPRAPELRGRVGTYRVRDIAEIDAHLRGLIAWLAARSAAFRGRPAPATVRRYQADVDALLERRWALMQQAAR